MRCGVHSVDKCHGACLVCHFDDLIDRIDCADCIADQEGLRHSIALALMIAIMAIFSLVVNIGKGSLWAELTTFVLICPAAILGGYLKEKQRVKKSKFQISKIK